MSMKVNNPLATGRTLLLDARIVTPESILESGWLLVENGRFAQMGSASEVPPATCSTDTVLNLAGATVVPGFIDLHTDTLENEITPRSGADLDIGIALQELEQKFLACGVTTIFHAISLGYQVSEDHRESRYSRAQMCYATHDFAQASALARTQVHLRYEISGAYALPDVHQAIDDGIVDLLSIMDHRPGWGQMSKERFLRNRRKHGLSELDALADFERRFNEPVIPRPELERLVEHAHTCGIYVASHDDVGPEQVSAMNQLGINIAEFPLSLEGAREALRLGMGTIGGAANSLRGGSLSGNLCVNSAIDDRSITALCSDYYPPALLHAPFQMERQGRLSLPEAINLVSLNPARLVGMADQTGSIEVGKLADFAVVEHRGNLPKVIQSWVGGRLVHQSSHRKLPATHPFPINAEPCDSL